MDEKIATRVVSRYLNLEDQLLELFKHIPPEGANLKAWSPTLASLIKESCGLFESTLKHITPNLVQVEGKQKRKRDLGIQDLAVLYSKKLGLTKWKVMLLYSSPPEYRDPLKGWKNRVQRKAFASPKWWVTHNHLKHDELASMDQATANTAIDALAGLLLTIGSAPELTRALMQRDLLSWKIVPPDTVVQWARGGFPQQTPVILKTTLFAVILGGPPLPKDIKDFRPFAHTGMPVLVPFFCKL